MERFSEGIVLALPPSCGHVFEDWRVETCVTRGDECDLREYIIGLIGRADRKSQVRQCWGFSTADFCTSFAYESAEEKP